MPRKAYTLTLSVRSPFLFAALDVAAPGLDSSALRDSRGNLLIPGDHIRGHLRHAFAALYGEGDDWKTLFGEESAAIDDKGGEQNIPKRGALIIGDLTQTSEVESLAAVKREIFHRVQIDDDTGAAANGMLQLIELGAPLGASVKFSGRVVLRGKNIKAGELHTKLSEALRLISAIGAVKSSGFGEVVQEETNKPTLVVDDAEPEEAKGWKLTQGAQTCFRLTVAFDRPLLVDSKMEGANAFHSSTIVPGSAIKGALALALEDAGIDLEDSNAFSQLRASHAFPLVSGKKADRALPANVALAKSGKEPNERFHAVDGFDEEALTALATHAAPRFPTDWKPAEFAKAQAAFERPYADLDRAVRGRVAIGRNGVAEDGNLFVVHMIETVGRKWVFDIDLGVDNALRSSILTALRDGLDGIGRTGACMKIVKVEDVHEVTCGTECMDILLETPAILTLADDSKSAFEQYKAYFAEIGATLEACFAQRGLAGRYYGYRFRAFGNNIYKPFEVTHSGAIFRLAVTDKSKFSACLKRGLPSLLKSAKSVAKPGDWRVTPFLPENGYGEISILDPRTVNSALECMTLENTAEEARNG